MNLYEIDTRYRDVLADMEKYAAEHDGEEDPNLSDYLDSIEMDRERKLSNIACFVKELRSEAAAIKIEKDRLAKREKSKNNKAQRLVNYLSAFMREGEKYEDERCSLSWKKSAAIHIGDVTQIPPHYLKTYVEPIKIELKKALQSGEKIPECNLVPNNSLQIK